jgi:hypothetical protein
MDYCIDRLCGNISYIAGEPFCRVRNDFIGNEFLFEDGKPHCPCEDYKEELIREYHAFDWEYGYDKSWNKPKGRCREGILDDTIKNKIHLDEYERRKERWKWFLHYLGEPWCSKHNFII